MGSSFARRSVVALFVGMSLVATAPIARAAEPSAADKETARTEMRMGRERRASHDLKGALEAFAAADAIMHVPTTGFEVARSQADLGQLVEARDTCLRVMRIAVEPGEPAPFQRARDDARALSDDLEKKIPTLTIKITGTGGFSPTVLVDGATVPPASLVAPRRLDPGHHVVTARLGTAEKKAEVDLGPGETKQVTLDLPPLAAQPTSQPATSPSAPAPPETHAGEEPRRGLKPITVVAFTVGAVGLVVGGVAGFLSLSKTSSAKDGCTADNLCPPPTHDDIDSAKTFALVSDIGFGVAIVGAGVGVVTLLTGKGSSQPPPASAHVEPWIGAGSAGLRGTF